MNLYPKLKVSDLKTGDTLLESDNTAIGLAIQIITRSKINHAMTYNKELNSVYEAIAKGYSLTPLAEALKGSKMVLVARPKFAYDEVKLVSTCEINLGVKYYYKGLWYQIKRQLKGGWDGLKQPIKLMCSIGAMYAYYISSGKFKNEWYMATPDDIRSNELDLDIYELEL